VTVAAPTLTDVTRPVVETVAVLVGVMVQATDGVLTVLPSLLVPNACICTVLSVLPVSMVGEDGPTEIVLKVGLTKNPLQLMVAPTASSTAQVPARWSLCFLDDMVI